jgi:hypothetical protein
VHSEPCPELETAFDEAVATVTDGGFGICELPEALLAVLKYFATGKLEDHPHRSLFHLLNASAKSDPDVQYLILAFACVLIGKTDLFLLNDVKKVFIDTADDLYKDKGVFFVTFGDAQSKAKRNLVRFSTIFASANRGISTNADIYDDCYGIEVIILWLIQYRPMRAPQYLDWLTLNCRDSASTTEKSPHKLRESSEDPLRFSPSPSRHRRSGPVNAKHPRSPGFNENSPVNSPLSSRSGGSPRQSRGVQSVSQEGQHTPRKGEVSGTIQRLVNLFVDWDSAYGASEAVWEVMKKDSTFRIDELYDALPLTFAQFLRAALEGFYVANV